MWLLSLSLCPFLHSNVLWRAPHLCRRCACCSRGAGQTRIY
jgi:hypothetical protein